MRIATLQAKLAQAKKDRADNLRWERMLKAGEQVVAQHALSENSMQVERYDDGHLFAQYAPHLSQQITLWIQFFRAAHRPVHMEVRRIHCPSMSL